jgi:hypothetical protein
VQYNNGINGARNSTEPRRTQSEVHLERVLERSLQQFILIERTVVCVAISDIVRCASIDGFLMLNPSNFYE